MSEELRFGGGFEKLFPEVLTSLPPFEFAIQSTEPTYYGADYLISTQAGYPHPFHSFASWTHGWTPSRKILHPKYLVSNFGGPDDRHLVANQNIAQDLRSFGYKDVHVVGLPFIYADQKNVKRIPNSLLIMPSHSLNHTQHQWPIQEYQKAIKKIKNEFEHVAACIHSSCVTNKNWYPELEAICIPWIVGAAGHDKNALIRMQRLFRSFEFITTNSIGSHIAYASYCGSKVSFYGPFSELEESNFKDDQFLKNEPEVLKLIINDYRIATAKQRFPEFFIHPTEAKEKIEWARAELGYYNRRAPTKIAKLLGWPPIAKPKKSILKRSIDYFLS